MFFSKLDKQINEVKRLQLKNKTKWVIENDRIEDWENGNLGEDERFVKVLHEPNDEDIKALRENIGLFKSAKNEKNKIRKQIRKDVSNENV